MKLPKILKAEWPGDLECPYCGENLNWYDYTLYPDEFILVQCQSCEKIFYSKQKLKTTYETKLWL